MAFGTTDQWFAFGDLRIISRMPRHLLIDARVVPEPVSELLLASGLAALGWFGRLSPRSHGCSQNTPCLRLRITQRTNQSQIYTKGDIRNFG